FGKFISRPSEKSRTLGNFRATGIHFAGELRTQSVQALACQTISCLAIADFSEAAQCRRKTMKCLITFLGFSVLFAQAAAAAREQPLLARVTVYWRSEGSGESASSTGARLREGP